MQLDQADPKGLVRESYAIEGISAGECRSIFIDWALSLPMAAATSAALATLIAHYGPGREDHPMTEVLRAALTAPDTPRRRGGRAGRMTARPD
ncbi:hypothetical protein KM031_16205 [Gemmobacter fulvus]|uniref:Uncharacterized protein n=1 Tax=Gemmobacter fulvus TaxID=2840474 RepID=A0A975P720_9RHOB|nr:hypothetical protein [Gemmobacter fulvus]MBT9245350.1 hypothetical protein [Gemmobacter fulvus]QWK90333.1 hypothetical protein KM031_16205 [Gemmobacter fulvus]